MSLFQTETARCPHCDGTIRFEVVYSLFADRRPDLREAVLDGSFQRETCPTCGRQMRMQPRFSYVDTKRHQWILSEPTTELANWPELEEVARQTFAVNYGPGANPIARQMGGAMLPRVTFGWAALCEKLLCVQEAIDDVALECSKLLLMRAGGVVPVGDDVDLRLVGADAATLRFAWVRSRDEVASEVLTVPRTLYDGVAKESEAWAPVRAALQEGWYVDINRLLVPAEAAPAG